MRRRQQYAPLLAVLRARWCEKLPLLRRGQLLLSIRRIRSNLQLVLDPVV